MDEQAAEGSRTAAAVTTPPTAALFAAQQAALRELMSGMDAEARWVVLLAADGSGKSTVIRALLDELRLATATVAIFEGRKTASVDDLAGALHKLLDLPRKRTIFGTDHSVSELVETQAARRKPLVVVVDDAEALATPAVKWLAGLAATASRTDTACYVVLAGTPALEKVATRAWARARSSRPSVRSILGPMTAGEIERYVEQWTRSGGAGSVTFSDAAIREIKTYSHGRPGLIGELCARAVALPGTRLTNQVSAEAVQEVARRLGVDHRPGVTVETARTRRSAGRAIGRVALGVGAMIFAALFVYVGVRVGLRLIETSPDSLDAPPRAVERSRPGPVRSAGGGAEPRRGAGTTTDTGVRRPAVAVPVTRQSPEPRPADTTPRRVDMAPRPADTTPPVSVATEASPQQVAAVMARAREGEVSELTRLLSAGVSPNVRDVGGFTPLMAAVVNDQAAAAGVLLDHGADVNARAHGGMTPLMLAVTNERPGAVKLLLDRGADVNVQTGAGWTALTFAVWKRDPAVVRVLLSHGARPNVIDKQGWRPVEYGWPELSPPEIQSRAGEREPSESKAGGAAGR